MTPKSLLAGLLSTITLASSNVTPGKVTVDYDQFKDETQVTLMGQQVRGQPVLQVLDSFPGRKPNRNSSLQVGFLISGGCRLPNFVADGKRVETAPGSEGAVGMALMPIRATLGGVDQVYTFVFNFYQIPSVAQIANAKAVEYKICDEVFTLAPQDQEYLRQVLNYYK